MLRTILLSILLFLILVSLGIKYHWVGLIKNEKSKQTALQIPAENIKNRPMNQQVIVDEKEEFKPEIMNKQNGEGLLASMTKRQITESCQKLFRRTVKNEVQVELLVGNCVVSNYHELLQELGADKPPLNRNSQVRQQSIIKSCREQVIYQKRKLSQLEKEILIGICVSNRSNK